MNAYLLTASFTRSQPALVNLGLRRSSCASTIVCADNEEEAKKRFEDWLRTPPEDGSSVDILIHKMVVAPFVDQMLKETESVPLDWPQIATQARSDLESTPADDFEQGYWVDVNAVLPPSINLDDLRRDLPEDISSGLNWADDKQFFFLLSVLSPPPPPPPEPWEEPEPGAADAAHPEEETADESAPVMGEAEADFPELAGKEAAALIRARNSAVAAWLWRNYAADTKLAGNQIRIDPWCGVVLPGANPDPDAAIAECNKAIELNPEYAMLYINRGSARETKGDLDGAIADFTKAIELKPDYAYGAYYNRGNAKSKKGDFEGAIADYSNAITLNPKYALAYHNRGSLRYHAHDFTEALMDFRKVCEVDSSLQDYARFQVWLVRVSLGEAEAASAELQTYLGSRATGKPDDWVSKIGRFLAGQLAEPEFLAVAKNADQEKEAGQLCQAYFYVGSKHLFAGDNAAAEDYFRKSIATNQRAYTEYSSAVAELGFLKDQNRVGSP